MQIDTAIFGDGNVIKKEAEKILKHEDFIIEIQPIWNVKEKVIPVIIETTATVSKLLRQHQSNLMGKHEVKELKKQPYLALHTYCGKC
jgi:hypothetical protein